MIEVGSWVAVRKRQGTIGFITKMYEHNCSIVVIENGVALEGEKIFPYHVLDELNITLNADDYRDLHYQHTNMALDTGDESWFSELHGKQTEGSK